VGKAFLIESLVKVLSQQIHVACMGNSGSFELTWIQSQPQSLNML